VLGRLIKEWGGMEPGPTHRFTVLGVLVRLIKH